MIDFRNTNSIWSSILVETLIRLGLTTVIICPGSRSTPLTVAFTRHKKITAIPILDERSAAFFALGIAKKSGLPVALVCTSGTAGANFYPAIIEAKESRVPLLILTADRPSELRDCHSGQTIDQVKLYGNYPNWQTELAVPSLEIEMLNYLRQTIIYAWEKSLFPVAGAVHLNLPFRDPLAPIPQGETEALASVFSVDNFWNNTEQNISCKIDNNIELNYHLDKWKNTEKGIIIAGVAQPHLAKEYCQAIATLSQFLKWPVLAEGLSPLRNYSQLNPYLISTYDIILRNQELSQKFTPEIVIQIGDFPTSKQLRNWLTSIHPIRWIIDPTYQNLDPLHGKTIHLRISIENLSAKISSGENLNNITNTYLQLWLNTETKIKQTIAKTMASIENIIEPKTAWLLSQTLPPETPIFIANSMPVRDVEFFWNVNNHRFQLFFNRGANGIDGTLSTALGIAYQNQSSVMLTGDLALLHDTNGFLIGNKFIGHLTIILINNNGGGIFEMLPISKFNPPFEEFFATPQNIDFAQLCTTYGVAYELIKNWQQLKQRLNPLPDQGIRVLELRTNRQADALWRQNNLGKFAINI